MKDTSYSVVIRTLGTGGAKYASLLKSLDMQTIKPRHIYVFIANGYELPKERLGNEEFIYCEKGMWKQRAYGMEYAAEHGDSQYLFVIDDDIKFSGTFISDCLDIIHQNKIDVLNPSVRANNDSLSSPKTSFFYRVKTAALGLRYETSHSEWQIKIARTAGFIANMDDSVNVRLTQSGQGAGLIIRNDAVAAMKLSEENWLDDTAYCLPEDQVLYYKAHCLGLKVANCKTPFLIHLDHGSSNPNRLINNAIAAGRNFYIFWYKFLFLKTDDKVERIKLKTAIEYRLAANSIWLLGKGILSGNLTEYKAYRKGIRMGRGYVDNLKRK